MVVSWIYFYITILVLKVLVVVPDSAVTKRKPDGGNDARPEEEEGLLSQFA